MVTPINEWKMKVGKETELPSGKTAELRRAGLPTFLKSGQVPNSLLGFVRGALAGKQVDVSKMEVSETLLDDMLELMDLVTIDSFVNPVVHRVPEDGERDPDRVYIDEIDFDDKQFLMQWAMGGTSDIAKFREQTEQQLAAVQAGQGVVNSPLPPPPG
jgi:hypothetical protein